MENGKVEINQIRGMQIVLIVAIKVVVIVKLKLFWEIIRIITRGESILLRNQESI